MEILTNNIPVILIVIAFIYLMTGIRIANEHERFVILTMGRFVRIKGPGLLFKLPGSSFVWHRVSLNEEGEYLGDGLAKVRNVVFRVNCEEKIRTGDIIKISSFQNNEISVIKNI